MFWFGTVAEHRTKKEEIKPDILCNADQDCCIAALLMSSATLAFLAYIMSWITTIYRGNKLNSARFLLLINL